MIVIKGKHIYLRALEPSDIDLIFEWENNAEVWNISDTVQPFSRFALEKYVSSVQDIYVQHQLRLIICEESSDTPIGCIDLFDFSPLHHRVGCGILIADQEQRGKGYAREALNLTIDYCFDFLECHQVYCNILEDNFQSINLFEKAGFERIGLKKEWINKKGKYHNEYLYQLLRSSHD
ncbi:MAG: GNAT family N-acetyltransferase [Crocinitomicaceae bacterium]|nr:GNAT family N-acetyltransferase [Crocinitomicaceae bacterium]